MLKKVINKIKKYYEVEEKEKSVLQDYILTVKTENGRLLTEENLKDLVQYVDVHEAYKINENNSFSFVWFIYNNVIIQIKKRG